MTTPRNSLGSMTSLELIEAGLADVDSKMDALSTGTQGIAARRLQTFTKRTGLPRQLRSTAEALLRKIPQFVLESRESSAIRLYRPGTTWREKASRPQHVGERQFNKFGKAQFEAYRKTTLSAVG